MSNRPTIPLAVKVEVLERQSLCFYCGKPLVPAIEGATEYDHVNARALGGADSASNLVAAHAACHRKKTNVDLAKIASNNRREAKRKRNAEKRALAKMARDQDLRKLIVRASDLVIEPKDDELGNVGESTGDGSKLRYSRQAGKKERPKTAWPKRKFGGGRSESGNGHTKDCEKDHGRDEGCEEA